jgi:hypothetical protein
VHERDIAEERDQSVAEMEAKQRLEKIAHSPLCPIDPSESTMPKKIVDDRALNGQPGCGQVIGLQSPEHRQLSKLHPDPDSSDETEFQKTAVCGSHAMVSSW